MAEESPLSVSDAAEILGVDERAVRFLASSGQLRGVKRGTSWWLDRRSVEQRLRDGPSPGRPLSPAMSWAILLLASGDAQALPGLAAHQPSRARQWLATHSLLKEATKFRARARREAFDVHPSELQRIVARDDVIRTGISAADTVGLHGGPREVELYAPEQIRDAIIAEHAAEPSEGPLLMRWMPDELWPAVRTGGAPRAAVLVDLLEHDDPRVRRQAAEALERL